MVYKFVTPVHSENICNEYSLKHSFVCAKETEQLSTNSAGILVRIKARLSPEEGDKDDTRAGMLLL